MSDFGNLAPAAVGLQEWLVDQYRRRCIKLGQRSDGCCLEDLVHQFRHKLKVGIQMAVAVGLGNMIQAAGQPWGRWARSHLTLSLNDGPPSCPVLVAHLL